MSAQIFMIHGGLCRFNNRSGFYSFGLFWGNIRSFEKTVCTITTIIAGFINIVVNLVLIPRIGLISSVFIYGN